MATVVEALNGAVFKDNYLDREAVRAVTDNLGFFTHPLLSTTDCGSLTGHAGTHPKDDGLVGLIPTFLTMVYESLQETTDRTHPSNRWIPRQISLSDTEDDCRWSKGRYLGP